MTAKLVKYVAGATAIAANTFVKLSSGLTVEQASATAIDCIGVQTNATVSGDIAIGDSEAILRGELVRTSPANARYAEAIGGVLK